jgi:anaerobic selenocysteine-containing dehydrogenase
LQFNQQAIPPLGEAKSNWTVMRLLASAMGFDEPWLHHSLEEALDEILTATRATNSRLKGVTLDRLKREGTVAYHFDQDEHVPFADGLFPTPSGKVELRCEAMGAHGLDPLPDFHPPSEFDSRAAADGQLVLLSGAAHHFVSSSMANQPGLAAKEGIPSIEIHPDDAAARGIANGDWVRVENARGWCQLRAQLTTDVRPGVAVAPKGHWPKRSPGERNVNFLTSDSLADLAKQATFHSNLVTVQKLGFAEVDREPQLAAASD